MQRFLVVVIILGALLMVRDTQEGSWIYSGLSKQLSWGSVH